MCSPRSGGAVLIAPGVAAKASGIPAWRITPIDGCSTSAVMPSAAASGDANASSTSATAPFGTSASSRRAAHSALDRVASRSAISGRSASRWTTRSPFVAKRGSAASSGVPIASQKRGHWRSDPTPTATSPSAVANVSYGTMFGWALPRRPGARPVTNAFWAWLTRTARVDPSSDTSTRCTPDSPRPINAARMPIAAYSPVTTSLIATPTFVGRPPSASRSPVIDMRPPTAWMTKS